MGAAGQGPHLPSRDWLSWWAELDTSWPATPALGHHLASEHTWCPFLQGPGVSQGGCGHALGRGKPGVQEQASWGSRSRGTGAVFTTCLRPDGPQWHEGAQRGPGAAEGFSLWDVLASPGMCVHMHRHSAKLSGIPGLLAQCSPKLSPYPPRPHSSAVDTLQVMLLRGGSEDVVQCVELGGGWESLRTSTGHEEGVARLAR